MDYKYEEEIRKIMDNVADGEKLTPQEQEKAEEFRPKNYFYNPHNGCMGRRYKDF